MERLGAGLSIDGLVVVTVTRVIFSGGFKKPSRRFLILT